MKLLFILLFLLYQRAQAEYYQVASGINQGTNFVSLNCQTDQVLDYNEAQWLYNGSVYSQSSCFSSASSSGSTLSFTLVSECDGYWQCGNGTEYSNFIRLVAYPRRTPDFTSQAITITKAIGEQITLPCHVRVSALNDHTVLWRIRTLTTNDLEGNVSPNNPDYSLTLINLNASNAKTYVCIVRSNTYNSASETGQTIHLHVVDYRIPQITDINAELRDDNMTVQFVASGRGTNIGFMWFLNRNRLTNTPGVVEIDNSNSLQSILRLQPLAATRSKVQQLDVVVSNTYEVNGTNNDTLTVFLYPAPSLPFSTIIHSPSPSITPLPTIPPDDGGLSTAMYSGMGVGFSVLVLIILILIGIVIALVCCHDRDKHSRQSRDVESVDRFFASMIRFLIDLDQRPNTSPSVKLEIDGLLNKIKKDKTANLESQVCDSRNYTDNDPQVVDSSSASGARCQADFSAPPPYFFETAFPHSYSALAEHKQVSL